MRLGSRRRRRSGLELYPLNWSLLSNPEGCQKIAGGRSPTETTGTQPLTILDPGGCRSFPRGSLMPFAKSGMPSTYLSLYYHIVFSTKHRSPSIELSLRHDLHQYLGGVVRGLEGSPESVGGVADHVHLLVSLKAAHSLADFMRELKKCSTAWIRDQGHPRHFCGRKGMPQSPQPNSAIISHPIYPRPGRTSSP